MTVPYSSPARYTVNLHPPPSLSRLSLHTASSSSSFSASTSASTRPTLVSVRKRKRPLWVDSDATASDEEVDGSSGGASGRSGRGSGEQRVERSPRDHGPREPQSHSHQLLTPPRPSPRRPSPSSRPAPSTPRYTARLTPSRQPPLSSTSKARYTARTGLEVNPIQPPRFLPSPRAVLRSPSKEGQKQSVGFTPLRQTLLSRRSAVDRSRLATSPQRAALDDQQEGEEEEDAKPTLEQLFDSLRQTYQGGPIDLCSSDESSSASDGAGFSDDNIWSDQEEEEEDEFDAFPPTDSRPLSPSKSTSSSSTSSTHRSTSLAHQRLSSSLRLLSTWEALLEKYNLPLEQDDEIDLTSGQLVVDRGVLKGSLGYMGRRYFLSGLTGVGDGSEGEDAEEGVDEGEDDDEEEEDLGGGQTIENHPFFGIDTSGQTDG